MSSEDGVASLAWTERVGSCIVSALGLRSRFFFSGTTSTTGVDGGGGASSGGGGSTTFFLFVEPFGRPLDFAGASIDGGGSEGMFSGASITSTATSFISSGEISIVILYYEYILIKGDLESDAALKQSNWNTLVVHKLKI
jgi:hypothetical protein